MTDQLDNMNSRAMPMGSLPTVSAPTMTSREISELTGSTHDNVLKTIRKLVGEGVVFGNETPYQHGQNGQTYQEYRLDYRNTMVVVSGYSAQLRARIIDRWQELEAKTAPPLTIDVRDPAQLVLITTQLIEVTKEQAQQIAIMAPKAEFHDAVGAAVNSQPFAQVAKVLGTGQNRLFEILRRAGVLMRNNQPYQPYVDQGYFKLIEKTRKDRNGDDRIYTQTHVTGRGLSWLQRKFFSAAAAA